VPDYRNNATEPAKSSMIPPARSVPSGVERAAEDAASIMIGIASVCGIRALSATAVSDSPARSGEVTAPWAAIPGGVIDGGELVLLAIKPSMWRPFFDSAAWVLGSWIVAGLLTMLGRPIAGFSMAMTVQILLMVGALGLAFSIVRWIPTWYVLTNRRIIDIRGVRTPRISSCELIEIRNTYVHASIEERVTGLGTVSFAFDKAQLGPRVWRSIANPIEVHAKIRRVIENAIDQYGIG